MNRPNRIIGWLLASLVVWALMAPAGAQERIEPLDPPVEPEPETLGVDELEALFQELTPEELQALIDEANARRLALEREHVVAEMRRGLLFDPQQIDEASAILDAATAATRAENVEVIIEALATVDDLFAKARDLLAAGDAAAAAATIKNQLDPNDRTFISATKHLVYGDALRANGQVHDAVEAYRQILKFMPDRISIAASAAVRAGQTYDQAGRMMYAMDMYCFCLKNYGLALSQAEVEQMRERLAELKAIFSDPLTSVADMMGEVGVRLEGADSGEQTQQTQDEIVAVLEDLIKTLEERQQPPSGGGGGNSQNRQRQRRQGQDDSEDSSSGARNPNRPSRPAEDSRLVPGELPEPMDLASVHDTEESGDWAQLPPRRQEEIQEIMRQGMSGRYQQLVEDYHRWLSEQGME
ncbi:MAG: hypothetical protein ACYTFO_09080 [Planctomycetota bacterium]|jgi:tetratricopeptide (TPR) repeat protein